MRHPSPPTSAVRASPFADDGASISQRWTWIEFFAAMQILWGVLLFIPGVQPFRMYVRAVPYAASLGALVWGTSRASSGRLPAASVWLMSSFALLAVNLLHVETYLAAGLAQVVLQISIAAPMFWAAGMVRDDARLARLLWIVFAASFVSSAVGILQAYDPVTFLPPQFSALAQQLNPAIIGALTYIGADGRPIIRPPGLSDLPGGAAVGGLITVVLAIAFLSHERRSPISRLFAAAAAMTGMTVLYLTQVRSLTIMAAVSVFIFAAIRLRQGRILHSGWIAAGSVAMVAASFVWATAIGGQAVQDRFSSLVETDLLTTFQQTRGLFLAYTFRDLLFQFPFGAGLGRWGMMQVYFSDPAMAHVPPIHVEIQITGWLLDGGFLMWVCYGGALAAAARMAYVSSVKAATDSLRYLSAMVLSLQLAIIGLCLTGPVFNTQLGVLFWTVTGALSGRWARTGPHRADPVG